ncbi:hypothetical protein [Porphyrobacter sp. YT40]|uniref:hypothetical protein n=1 Tax=Porphyrobacter sp. YT40 TaxID=2547601 RepID=UPI001143E233|nr:hypothetical protein [Porphyrobacter sp. YT40]QDH34582.1 hypothetical protein E2E27_09740 [Porphyrobacter sp. YT40]
MPMTTRHIVPLVAAGLAVAALAVGSQAGTINSNLMIEPAKTFELGGGQDGGFVVTGTNVGPVAVVVSGKAPDGTIVQRGTVSAGGAVDARFASGEMALLRNTSGAQTARLTLKVTGDTAALGMSYSDNP